MRIFCLLAISSAIAAQATIQLEDVLNAVIKNSFPAEIAANQKALAAASYDLYKAELKPTLNLSADLPQYSKTFAPIIQPDGTVAFTSIRQANSSVSLFATQVIPQTGGTLFLNSDLQRFDDFSLESKQYNGNPIRLGINQPLFGFNPWKYRKGIEDLMVKESLRQYNINIEEALRNATDLYFNILIAQQNLEIAKTNQLVNEKLLVITDERLELGKVSRDEKLQLEIELNNAKLNVSQADREVGGAVASLYTFLSQQAPGSESEFEIPAMREKTTVDSDLVMSHYKENRPEILAYQREKKENERDRAQTKADLGIRADLQASIGLARGADNYQDVYSDPFDEQRFNVSLLVPIVDWGKRRSAMKQIEILDRNIDAVYEQQFLELENQISQQVIQFERLQTEITLLKEIMDKAEERFTISNQRYVLGNIDITNLTLAQREKDQTKRNYLSALKSYWVTYYQLRALSGYDIINNQTITYNS